MTGILTKREIDLIRILSANKGFTGTDQICEKMEIKPRTLRECVRLFRDSHAERAGVEIESRPGFGYRLKIKDPDRYRSFLNVLSETEDSGHDRVPVYPEERVQYIIRTLLSENDYRKSEDLADSMYISRSTFAEDLRRVKEVLGEYDLKLSSQSRRGIKIEGSEICIRDAIAAFFFENEDFDAQKTRKSVARYFTEEQYSRIRSILWKTLKAHDFMMSDASFRNLAIHLLIALNRISDRTVIPEHPSGVFADLRDTKEWTIAEDLYRQLSEETGVHIPETEIGYVTIHLRGKKMISDESEMVLYPETLNMLAQILQSVREKFGYDFSGDIELYGALAMHMQPLLERLKYGLRIHNPLLDQIHTDNPEAFDIAVYAASMMNEKTGAEIDENEIGYLALHFSMAMERLDIQKKKRILVICASGAGTSRLLAYRVRKNFADSIDTVDTMSYFDLQNHPDCGYDLILSTVPIYFPVSAPVLRIKEIPDMEDFGRIDTALQENPADLDFLQNCFDRDLIFPDQDLHDPETIILQLADAIAAKTAVEPGFGPMVLERERLSSTAIGNMVAFPHAARPMSDVTKVAVMSLKEPCDWYGTKVRLIFLTTVQRNGSREFAAFSEAMSALFTDKEILGCLMDRLTYDGLTGCLRKLYREPEEDIFQ